VKKKKSIFNYVWDKLNSIKFAIVILIILALISILSIYIQEKFPMNRGLDYYRENFTGAEFRLFKFLGFFDPYHSFWYLILLGLLILNISVCTINRLGFYLKNVFKIEFFNNENQILKLKLNRKKSIKGDINQIQDFVKTYFKKKRYRIFEKTSDGRIDLFLTKGRLNRFAFPLIHLSIIFICLGGVTGNLFGFKSYKLAVIGEIFKAPKKDFFIIVEDIWMDTTVDGQPIDYYSKLTVIENHKEVKHKTIEVNSPLEYKGLKFYQSDFGMNPTAIKKAKIEVDYKNQDKNEVIYLSKGQKINIQRGNYQIELNRYVCHFTMDENNDIFSASSDPENPAVQVNIYRENKKIEDRWLFLKFPEFHMKSKIDDFKLKFTDFEPENYTGLQIGYNPGAPLLWIGFILITIGIVFAFYISHKKYWITMVKDKNIVLLYIAAKPNKNLLGLKREFEKFIKVVNNIN